MPPVGDARPDGDFVVSSEISVPAAGAPALEAAFRDRLGRVDDWPGFRGLEVWADLGDDTRYVMVSRWRDREDFLAYMRSEDHRASHDRIPDGEHRPRPREVRRYRVIAT